jgi:hypothetical protein
LKKLIGTGRIVVFIYSLVQLKMANQLIEAIIFGDDVITKDPSDAR